jgi:hypothetical protein
MQQEVVYKTDEALFRDQICEPHPVPFLTNSPKKVIPQPLLHPFVARHNATNTHHCEADTQRPILTMARGFGTLMSGQRDTTAGV